MLHTFTFRPWTESVADAPLRATIRRRIRRPKIRENSFEERCHLPGIANCMYTTGIPFPSLRAVFTKPGAPPTRPAEPLDLTLRSLAGPCDRWSGEKKKRRTRDGTGRIRPHPHGSGSTRPKEAWHLNAKSLVPICVSIVAMDSSPAEAFFGLCPNPTLYRQRNIYPLQNTGFFLTTEAEMKHAVVLRLTFLYISTPGPFVCTMDRSFGAQTSR